MDNRLKQLRIEHGYSTRSLAEALTEFGFKTTSITISRYERGEREPKLATWQKLADFFDVSVPYIQGIESKTETDSLRKTLVADKEAEIRIQKEILEGLKKLKLLESNPNSKNFTEQLSDIQQKLDNMLKTVNSRIDKIDDIKRKVDDIDNM